jgi:hypothetical protein
MFGVSPIGSKDGSKVETRRMPQAKLAVDVPSETWIHEVSTNHPETVFRVVTALTGDGFGIGLLELESADALAVLSSMRGHPSIRDLDLLWKREQTAVVQVETEDTALLVPALRASVPPETPFEVRDGETTWRLSTTAERLSALGEQLDDAGVDYDVVQIRQFENDGGDHPLTDRQAEVLLAAIDRGYYDTPRKTTLTDLAADLDVSKATVSEVLHRAEGKVLPGFADEHLR